MPLQQGMQLVLAPLQLVQALLNNIRHVVGYPSLNLLEFGGEVAN